MMQLQGICGVIKNIGRYSNTQTKSIFEEFSEIKTYHDDSSDF